MYYVSSVYNMDGFVEYGLLVLYLLLLCIVVGEGFMIILSIVYLSYCSVSGICICMNGIQ